MTAYVVVYVGCIECGVPTHLVGVYSSQPDAAAAAAEVESGGDSWARHGGEGFLAVWGPVVVGESRDPGNRDTRDHDSGDLWPEAAA